MRLFKWVLAIFLIGIVFLSGCSHPLTVKNLRSYQTQMPVPLDQRLVIGIVPQSGDCDSERILRTLPAALSSNADVIMPYQRGSSRKVDVIADISIQPDYRGSGWNFLINWPGFLIFTPAWNGYVYKVNYKVDVALTKAEENQPISSFDIPINLNVRHAAMNRTWTEISWLEVSIIAFVGGLVFIDFDDQVSALTAEKVKDVLAEYISAEILYKLRMDNYAKYQN
jgi:hypothetical protein